MSALCDDEVKNYLESLHRRFVIATIDKAPNNYALLSKRFYINSLFTELGIFSSSNN